MMTEYQEAGCSRGCMQQLGTPCCHISVWFEISWHQISNDQPLPDKLLNRFSIYRTLWQLGVRPKPH